MHDLSDRSAQRLTAEQIQQRVQELGTWFHNIDLGGIQTAPEHFLGDYPALKWQQFAHALPPNLQGQSVLDIGCNGGFYAIEMKHRGADRVVGIDTDPIYLAQARFAAEVSHVDIELHQLSVYDVARLGETFDLVLFMGVFYHLRHPLLALDLIHEHVARNLFVFQSMLRGSSDVAPMADDYPFEESQLFHRSDIPRLHFIEKQYAGDPTNWWIPNRACVEALLRHAGFDMLSPPEEEVFVCRRQARPSGCRAVYPAANDKSQGEINSDGNCQLRC